MRKIKIFENNNFKNRKFNVFSQFLFDEMVQSPLIREDRYFKENKVIFKINKLFLFLSLGGIKQFLSI